MAFNLAKGRVSPIGVDFGADAIKLLQVVPTDPPQLVAAGVAEVPEHARRDPAARQQFYEESLKHLLRTQPFKGRRAVCSIPAYQTLVHHFQVPRNEASDVTEHVGLQLRQRLNVDASRMILRVHRVGAVARDPGKEEVICLAAGRDAVMRHIENAHRAKLDVVGMQCEPMAVMHAFAHLFKGPEAEARTTCIVDIGAATTKALIANGGRLVFCKNIHAGGESLNRALAQALHLSPHEARQLRRNAPGATATPTAARDAGSVALAEAPEREAEACRETLECITDELQMCLRYYATMFPDRVVERLVFVGGEARHRATCQAIARALRLPAQLGDPLGRLARTGRGDAVPDFAQPQPGWAVALGLCLSETEA